MTTFFGLQEREVLYHVREVKNRAPGAEPKSLDFVSGFEASTVPRLPPHVPNVVIKLPPALLDT